MVPQECLNPLAGFFLCWPYLEEFSDYQTGLNPLAGFFLCWLWLLRKECFQGSTKLFFHPSFNTVSGVESSLKKKASIQCL